MVFIVLIIIPLIMIITIFFGIVIFKNNVNSILHILRNDIYMINRNALFALERDLMGKDTEKFYDEEILELVEDEILHTWGPDKKFIKNIKILQVEALMPGEYDDVTGKKIEDMTIHNLIEVEIRPFIFVKMLEKEFCFKIHEDVKVNKMKT